MDEQIERHVERIRNRQAEMKALSDSFKLTMQVMLRRTGAVNNHDGTYIIQLNDLEAWFGNGDHLRHYTDYDLL